MSGKREKKTRDRPVPQIEDFAAVSLEYVEDALAERTKLTERFLREIEKEIAEALRLLGFLGDPWQRGDRTEYEFMRIALDKALTSRKKERRDRLLTAWKDLLELRQKRIELLKELAALGQ